LIKTDNVIAIIGDVASSPTLAIAPIANTNKIIVVSPAASSPEITNAGPFIYRVWPSDVFEADRMAEHVKKQHVKSIGILYVNNDYGLAMTKEFKKLLEQSNTIIVGEENFDQNTTDVRAQLARIKKMNPGYIYLISYPKDSVIILKQYKELGLKSKLLSTSSFEDPLILKEVGKIADGTVITSPVSADPNDPIVSNFRTSYQKRFGEKPGLVADYGYDSLGIILEALRLSKDYSREGVYKGIQMIKDFKGSTGLIKFDQNGDVIKPAGIKLLNKEQYTWIEK
jgi:branched-chain amino acid transport system substrate-binding protein